MNNELEKPADICISLTKVQQMSPTASSFSLIRGVHTMLYRAAGGSCGDVSALWATIQNQLAAAAASGVSYRCAILVDSRVWGRT